MTLDELRKAAERVIDKNAALDDRNIAMFDMKAALTPERVLALCNGYQAMVDEMICTGVDCSTGIEKAVFDIEAAFGEEGAQDGS